MNDKLKQFLDNAFMPYGNFPARKDVEQELLSNLTEKYNDLKADGKTDEEAYQLTIESFGDVSEIMEHVAHDTGASKEDGAQESRESIVDRIKNGFRSGDPRFRATSITEADLSDSQLAGTDFSMSALMGQTLINQTYADQNSKLLH